MWEANPAATAAAGTRGWDGRRLSVQWAVGGWMWEAGASAAGATGSGGGCWFPTQLELGSPGPLASEVDDGTAVLDGPDGEG